MKRVIGLAICIMFVFSLILPSSALSSVAVKGIKLDTGKVSLTIGQTYQLKFTLTPASTTQKLVKYTTSNSKVVTIDAKGNITAIGAGSATVTVTSQSKSSIYAKCSITVSKPPHITITEGFTTGDIPQTVLDDFNKANPNITVKPRSNGTDGKNMSILMSEIAAGTAPDIIYVGEGSIPGLVASKLLTPLDSYMAKSTQFPSADLLPVMNAMRFDGINQGKGPIYGIPKDWNVEMDIIVNKKTFAALGITPPSPNVSMTLSQLDALCTEIQNKAGNKIVDGIPTENVIPYQLNDGCTDVFMLLSLFDTQIGGSVWSSDFSKPNFTDAKFDKVLNKYTDMVKKGNIQVTGTQISGTDAYAKGNGMNGNTIAMVSMGYWSWNFYPEQDNYYFIPAPHMDGGKNTTFCSDAVAGTIYSGSKNKDAAFKFLEYFMGKDGKPANDRAASGWGYSIFKSKINMMPNKGAFCQSGIDVYNYDSKILAAPPLINPYVSETAMLSLWNTYFPPTVAGKNTVKDLEKSLTDAAIPLIQQGRIIAGKE